jgi:hypothetical protein
MIMKNFVIMYKFNGDLKIKTTDNDEVFNMWREVMTGSDAKKYEYIYGCTIDVEEDMMKRTNNSLTNIVELWNHLAKELGSTVEINLESLIEDENENIITHCTFTTKDLFSAKTTIKPTVYFNAAVDSFFKDIKVRAYWVCDGVYILRF